MAPMALRPVRSVRPGGWIDAAGRGTGRVAAVWCVPGTITVRNSEFDHNLPAGTDPATGLTHGFYAGPIARVTIEDSSVHDAATGHHIKSRAAETIVTNTRIHDGGLALHVEAETPWGTLTSTTAARRWRAVLSQDWDFTSADLAYRPDDGSWSNRFRTFSQELRLQGNAFNNRLDWLIGGYYANEKLHQTDNLSYGADYTRYANCLAAYKIGYGLFASGFNGSSAALPVRSAARCSARR